jgi:predicted RNA-binding protein YlqC (UPF0109 family)
VAKFEDYAKQRQEAGELEQEINEAARQTEERNSEEDVVPERFKNKTKAEIASAWEDANQLITRQGQELGDLRRTVSQLVEKQSKTPEPSRPAPKPVTMDELYETPDEAVRRVAREESSPRIEALEQELEQAKAQVSVAEGRRLFEQKHPTYKDTMADPEFMNWIKKSNVRTSLAVAADRGNFDAADELFSTYTELKEAKTKGNKPAARVDEAREVALERSGGTAPAPTETFSRFELQEKRIAAQRGDRKARRWLDANAGSIQSAYAENRLTA